MPAKSMIDRYAESLVDIATRYRGRSMATVERIITGPTRTAGLHWLVVLYRSTEVSRGEPQGPCSRPGAMPAHDGPVDATTDRPARRITSVVTPPL